MNIKYTLFCFLFASIWCAFAAANKAHAITDLAIETHNIKQISDQQFIIDGADPYLRFSAINSLDTSVSTTDLATSNLANINDEQTNRYLILNVNLENTPLGLEDISMEVFFRAMPDTGNRIFDPRYRLRFRVPIKQLSSDKGGISIALPNAQSFLPRHPMRLDIDHCPKCTLTMVSHPKLAATLPDDVTLITTYRVYNGIHHLDDSGLPLSTANWLARDLIKSNEGDYTLDGNDAFLISPHLDIATAQLGGLHFELSASDTQTDSHDFQLFYSTEQHGFIEQASTSVRVKSSQNGIFTFTIPLTFLGTEQPIVATLERIRLDLVTADKQTRWQLKTAKVLHRNQLADYVNHIPTRRLEAKRQRAQGWHLIIKSARKVLSDPAFSFAYLLLLLVTFVSFWRAYRR